MVRFYFINRLDNDRFIVICAIQASKIETATVLWKIQDLLWESAKNSNGNCAQNNCTGKKSNNWVISAYKGCFLVNKELRKEAYLEPHQTFKMDLFKEIVNGFKSLKIFEKSFILDAGMSSQYTSEDKTNISYPFSEAYPEHRTTSEIKVAAKMVND